MKLQQIFYGHDGTQYRILSSSTDDDTIKTQASHLCEAVGTQDNQYFKPFLLSVRWQNKLYMAQCCRGKQDNSNRNTMLFHVLIGDYREAGEEHVNAFSLEEAGIFSKKESETPSEIYVKPKEIDTPSAEFSWDGTPQVIISEQSENTLIHALLKDQVNEVNWASYSFKELNNFKLYVLSKHAALPQNISIRKKSGEFITRIDTIVESVSPLPEVLPEKSQTAPKKSIFLRLVKFTLEMFYLCCFTLSILLNFYLFNELEKTKKITPPVQITDDSTDPVQDPIQPKEPPIKPQEPESGFRSVADIEMDLNNFDGKDPNKLKSLLLDAQRTITQRKEPNSWEEFDNSSLKDTVLNTIQKYFNAIQNNKDIDIYDKNNKLDDAWEIIKYSLPLKYSDFHNTLSSLKNDNENEIKKLEEKVIYQYKANLSKSASSGVNPITQIKLLYNNVLYSQPRISIECKNNIITETDNKLKSVLWDNRHSEDFASITQAISNNFPNDCILRSVSFSNNYLKTKYTIQILGVYFVPQQNNDNTIKQTNEINTESEDILLKVILPSIKEKDDNISITLKKEKGTNREYEQFKTSAYSNKSITLNIKLEETNFFPFKNPSLISYSPIKINNDNNSNPQSQSNNTDVKSIWAEPNPNESMLNKSQRLIVRYLLTSCKDFNTLWNESFGQDNVGGMN